MSKKAFLFDGNSFCYRAFYAIGHLSNSHGLPTNAVYGFLTMIQKILHDESPEYCAMCFDLPDETFRKKKFKEYKVHRQPMPDELRVQMPYIKEVVSALRIPIFECPGYEADDVLGTLATRLAQEKIEVFIVTGDKDALQLVTDRIKIYNVYRDTVTIYDRDKVKERYDGLGPESITDIMALMGDASDNIPGVSGFGEKTAVSFIKQYHSLENLFERIDSVSSASKQKVLRDEKENAILSKELATIDCAVPLSIEKDALKRQGPDTERLQELYRTLEFKSLLQELPTAPQRDEGRQYHTIASRADFDALVANLQKQRAFSFDTETTSAVALSAELVGMSFSWKEKEAYYVVLMHEGIETKSGIPLAYACERLKPILENCESAKYGHNIKYDLLVMSRYGIHLAGIACDTMIASYLLAPAKFNHNLDDCSLAFLKVQKISFESLVGTGKDEKRIDAVPVERVAEYACEDADCVWRLVPIMRAQLREQRLEELFDTIEMPLVPVLARMEQQGVNLDVPLLKKLSEKAEKELEKLTTHIYHEAGEEFNINSPKQLSTLLFDKLQLPVIKKTKTGYSTDVSVLEELAEKHPLPRLILEYREYAKLKSTYLDALPALRNSETGRVHTSFNQTVTATGRLSSSDPNVQNIPVKTELGREIRKAFIPSGPHRKILSADYSQIELRLLAHFSQDEKLIDAFSHDRDIHTYTATVLYGVSEAEVTGDMRHVAKTINFSIIYGKTAFGLSRDLGIPVSEAHAFIAAYFERYPGIQPYMNSLKEDARTKGYVTTLYGRRAYFPDITSRNVAMRQFAERAATNAPLQGSAADLIKKAMIQIAKDIEKHQIDASMILQVHDELVFDVAEKDAAHLTELVVHAMEHAAVLRVPLKVDVSCGTSWYE